MGLCKYHKLDFCQFIGRSFNILSLQLLFKSIKFVRVLFTFHIHKISYISETACRVAKIAIISTPRAHFTFAITFCDQRWFSTIENGLQRPFGSHEYIKSAMSGKQIIESQTRMIISTTRGKCTLCQFVSYFTIYGMLSNFPQIYLVHQIQESWDFIKPDFSEKLGLFLNSVLYVVVIY